MPRPHTQSQIKDPGQVGTALAAPSSSSSGVGSDSVKGRRSNLKRAVPWFILFAVVGACGGAGLGWGLTHPRYRAVGQVQLTPLIHSDNASQAQTQPPQTQPPETQALARQVEVLKSRPVLRAAVARANARDRSTAEPAAHNKPNPTPGEPGEPDQTNLEPLRQWTQRLSIWSAPASPARIKIAFASPTRTRAVAGVRAMLEAYQQTEQFALQARRARLWNQASSLGTTLNDQIDKLENRLASRKQADGPVPLDQVYENQLDAFNRLSHRLSEMRLALELLADRNGASPVQETSQAKTSQAREDADVRAGQGELWHHLPQVLARWLGHTPSGERVVPSNIAWPEPRIALRLNGAHVQGQTLLTRAQLRDRVARLTARREAQRDRLAQLRQKQQARGALGQKLASTRRRKARIKNQLAQIAAVAPPIEIEVLGSVDRPLSPWRDPRPARAGIGGLAGLVLGLIVPLPLLWRDRSLHRPEDAAQDRGGATSTMLIGSMPRVDQATSTPDDARLTALSLHQLRARLESLAQPGHAQALALTSPVEQAGKTSLTVGLGSSLAMAGYRTLVIDSDLAGRKNQAPADLAQNSDQPGPARGDPSDPGPQQLDQVLLDMGYLDDNQTERFVDPAAHHMGFTALLHGQPLEQCVMRTRVAGLSVLPALSSRLEHVGQLSRRFVRRLIDEARADYDFVLFDSGCIPGSVEALLIAGEADGVVMVASTGQKQSQIDKARAQLRMIGAPLLGYVFNRARWEDLGVADHQPRRRKRAKGRRGTKALSQDPNTPDNPDAEAAPKALPGAPASHAATSGSGIFAAAVEIQGQHPAAEQAYQSTVDAAEQGPVTNAGSNSHEQAPPTPGEAKLLDDLAAILPPDDAHRQSASPSADSASHTPAANSHADDDDLGPLIDQMLESSGTPRNSAPTQGNRRA